jgi:hypothetical protein
VTVAASIVADNSAVTGPNCFGTITSAGSNLSNDASCSFTAPGDNQNSANINLAPLADNGGPTQTMLPALTSDAIDNAACLISEDQRGISRPQGAGCDIGSIELRQGATFPLCVSRYTGLVSSPLTGGCGAGQVALVVPGNLSFCIDPYTGRVHYRFGRPCSPPRRTHVLPDNGDLLTCVSRYTGVNRAVLNHSQCTAYEVANTIPAAP